MGTYFTLLNGTLKMVKMVFKKMLTDIITNKSCQQIFTKRKKERNFLEYV